MQISLKHFAETFGVFIRTSGKYLLFTSLFYALWLVKASLLNQDFDLHRFPGRMIGIATFEAYDVGARVSLYYKCILLLLFSFLAFNFLGYLIHKKKPELFSGSEIKLLNASSLAGIVFMLFQLCDFKCEETLELVYFTHKFVAAGLLLKLLLFRKNQLSVFSYVLAIVVSVTLYFFVSDVMSLSGASTNPDFLITTFFLCCLSLIVLNSLLNADRKPSRLSTFAYILVPLTFLPFISILKDEIFLVFKTNGTTLSGTSAIYASLLLVLSVWIFLRYKKSKKQALPTLKESISRNYFPLLVFSLVSYILYSPFINYTNEVFEAGNKYLAVMEFKLFGVIPTLEKFNSHLVSDYFFSAVYTFFNGLQGREMELYDFLYTSISFTLFYYLVYFITRNPFVAIFSILLFPFSGSLLPEQYSFSVLCIFAFHKLSSGNQILKNYLFFFGTITAVILWRIDLGYSCVVGIVLLTLYYHFFSNHFKINWALLLKSLGIIFGAVLTLFLCLSLYRHQNLFAKLTYALNYLNSAQTYGYSGVSPEKNLIYKMHYFVFPAVVTILLLALLIKNKELNKSRGQRLAYLSLLFTAAFYLVNFNRGLIRHSLVEGVDHFTTSLAYIVFAGSVFVFSKRGTQYYKFIAFCSIAFFTLITYKLPDPKNSLGYFEMLLSKLNNPEKINLAEINDRVKKRPTDDRNTSKAFVDFIAKNTTSEETFIDFCNSPMLFYYTKKITPSYFLQNPACSHNDFLQNVFIEDLKDYKTPYLAFRRNDDMSRDRLDEVDNTFRHYRIAEYLFQHYTPYVDIDQIDVWRRNDVKNKNTIREIYSFKRSSSDSLIQFEFKSKAGKKYFAKLNLDGREINLNSTNTNIHFHLPEYINNNLFYCPVETGESGSKINLKQTTIKSFQLMECDYIPDVSYEKYFSYELQKLPYIWGTYDEKMDKEPILFEKNINASLNPSAPHTIEIPVQLDRTSGNTLIVHCKNTSTKIQELVISFGNVKNAGRSKISFQVLPSEKEERYAIRVSSVYKWYSDKINVIEILPSTSEVTISKIQLTKGM